VIEAVVALLAFGALAFGLWWGAMLGKETRDRAHSAGEGGNSGYASASFWAADNCDGGDLGGGDCGGGADGGD
jgi:hypothetical protein